MIDVNKYDRHHRIERPYRPGEIIIQVTGDEDDPTTEKVYNVVLVGDINVSGGRCDCCAAAVMPWYRLIGTIEDAAARAIWTSRLGRTVTYGSFAGTEGVTL